MTRKLRSALWWLAPQALALYLYWAGLLASVFWIASSKLVVVMSWSSEYMLVLCIFLLLLAFHFLLRYAATGERSYWRYCGIVYLTGFLNMESNIVFPLLAASYASSTPGRFSARRCCCWSRRRFMARCT